MFKVTDPTNTAGVSSINLNFTFSVLDAKSTWDVLEGLGFKDAINSYAKIRDYYLPRVSVDPKKVQEIRETYAKSSGNLRDRIFSTYSIDQIIKLKFNLLGLKLQHIVLENEIIQELNKKDVPFDVFLWNKQLGNAFIQYLMVLDRIEEIDASLSGNFDKDLIKPLQDKLSSLNLSNEELQIATTPIKLYAPLQIISDYLLNQKDIKKHFFFSDALEKKFLEENQITIKNEEMQNKVSALQKKQEKIREAKRALAERYGSIIWDLELLLQFDNFFSVSTGRIAQIEIEHIPIRQELYNQIFDTNADILNSFLKIKEHLQHKKTFAENYVFQPIPIKYKQRYICIAAAPINAISVWSNNIRNKNEKELIQLERDTYLASTMKQVVGNDYFNALIDFGILYLKEKFDVDDIINLSKLTEEWEALGNKEFWEAGNKEYIHKMLNSYGFMPKKALFLGKHIKEWNTELSDDFVTSFIEFNRKALEIEEQQFKNINKVPTKDDIIDLLDKGYSVAAHVPIGGGIQHVIVIYGYSKNKNKIYTYDQLTSKQQDVEFDNVEAFLKMPTGWTVWGFRKQLDIIDKINKVIAQDKQFLNSFEKSLDKNAIRKADT
jgi:hypothetical protein